MDVLREFFPEAEDGEWTLENAGQRVQIIKKDSKKGGALQFGTELVAAADGSISALLGASPGASTAVTIMLELLEKCFPKEMQSDAWKSQLTELVPSYGTQLVEEPEAFSSIHERVDSRLGLS